VHSRTEGALLRPHIPAQAPVRNLLSARIQDAVWRRQVLVGYTPMRGDAKQNRDDGHGVAHAPANKRCGSSAQAQVWVIQRRFDGSRSRG
jgi:hypothetical protein